MSAVWLARHQQPRLYIPPLVTIWCPPRIQRRAWVLGLQPGQPEVLGNLHQTSCEDHRGLYSLAREGPGVANLPQKEERRPNSASLPSPS